MNEICSGWDNVGHNSLRDLIMMWIVPKYDAGIPE